MVAQDDMVGSKEVDHLEGERLCMVVALVFESDRHINLPEGDGLLAQNHFIEWVRAGLE
jgi:hypothetical protein